MNRKEFYEQISLADNGAFNVESVPQSGSAYNPLNQYEFFKNINLNDNGYINIVITNP